MFSEAIENLSFHAPGEVNTTSPVWNNSIASILRLTKEEQVYKVEGRETEFKVLILLEQMNTMWTKGIIQRFKEPSNLVKDAFARAFFCQQDLLASPKV